MIPASLIPQARWGDTGDMLIRSLIDSQHDRPPEPDAEDFTSRLRLQQIDRDLFTGWCHAGAPMRAFGGQVAAQALVAAGATVDEEGRDVHSLHAYFLRPGRTTDRIVYMVDRPRDGKSFTTRRVRAVQYGEVIFTMSASFSIPQQGPSHRRDSPAPSWWGDLPTPESLAPERVFDHLSVSQQELVEHGYPTRQRFDIRVIPPPDAYRLSAGRFDRMVWVRSAQRLPSIQLLHVCVLTYFSDLNMVGTVMGAHGGRARTRGLDIASLDHTMWVHEPFRSDEWLLFATDSPASGHGRGLARGEFFSQQGRLSASIAQEVLIREPFRKNQDHEQA